jgi:hypothetical protein
MRKCNWTDCFRESGHCDNNFKHKVFYYTKRNKHRRKLLLCEEHLNTLRK